MAKLRTIIAEDEPLLRKELRGKLEENPDIDIVAECENGLQAVEAVNRLQPDLLFLDIVMPCMSGFEVVEALQSDTMPAIIFATAYDQFALKAFDVRAIDYLVKPYSDERLLQGIETAKRNRLESASDKKSNIIDLVSDLNNREIGEAFSEQGHGFPKELIVENKDPQISVVVEDISWIDAAGDYMCIHANGETYIMRCTMKRLTEQLNPDFFKRIHRSTIVNIRRVVGLQPYRKGDYFVDLQGGTRLRLSRSYNDQLPVLTAVVDQQKKPL